MFATRYATLFIYFASPPLLPLPRLPPLSLLILLFHFAALFSPTTHFFDIFR